jgi:hypothetical protein
VSYNLGLIAAHQIGHSLGLEHTNESNSLMYPFYQRIVPKDMLSEQVSKIIVFLPPYHNRKEISEIH